MCMCVNLFIYLFLGICIMCKLEQNLARQQPENYIRVLQIKHRPSETTTNNSTTTNTNTTITNTDVVEIILHYVHINRYKLISFRHLTIPICISNATTPHQRSIKATIWVLAHCYGGSSNPKVALKCPNYPNIFILEC